jgi:hypothetical protein
VTTPSVPARIKPDRKWTHYRVWERVNTAFYSLPNYFETELVIKGINVTEIFAVGGAFSSVVETQVVTILNSLRSLWDPDNEYFRYAFIRQAQTFPDVLLQNVQDEKEVLFGVELKSKAVIPQGPDSK